MDEVNRNLISRFGLTPEKAAYCAAEIRRHFPEAWVEGYDSLIPTLTTHEKDRHVLAAAIRCGAEVIVTYNLKDFPSAALSPWSISTVGPSAFLKSLCQSHREAVLEVLEQQAAAIRKPLSYLLARLRINVPGFVAALDGSL